MGSNASTATASGRRKCTVAIYGYDFSGSYLGLSTLVCLSIFCTTDRTLQKIKNNKIH